MSSIRSYLKKQFAGYLSFDMHHLEIACLTSEATLRPIARAVLGVKKLPRKELALSFDQFADVVTEFIRREEGGTLVERKGYRRRG